MTINGYPRANEFNLCFVLIVAMKKPRKASAEIICAACDGTGVEKVKQPTQPQNLSPEMHGMSRQRPNKEASRNVSLDRSESAINDSG